ncbi:hypothetical protein [Bosea sp. (in: a-proteobacteria)]
MDHLPLPAIAKAAPMGPRSAAPETGDECWKRLTEQANKAYAEGRIAVARSGYEQALAEAERLFAAAARDAGALPLPVIYNISCHNLAELNERYGEVAKAEAWYRRAYERLLETARSPMAPLALRMTSVQHLKHALAVLVRHLRDREVADEAIGAIISEARHAAYTVFRIAQHAAQAEAACPHCPITRS